MSRQTTGDYDEEYRIIRPDGSIRWVRDRAFPVRDSSGQIIRVAGVAEDITERRQLEVQLRQVQKMEAIGQLAGGVAHDFNNLLTIISGCTSLAQARVTSDPELSGLLTEVLAAAERSAGLTRQLLAFSRRQLLSPHILDLREIVRDTEKLLRRVIGEDVRLITREPDQLRPIKADPSQIEQILLNLAVNARDAMPSGGTVTIQTADVDVRHGDGPPGLEPGAYVRLSVQDTGVGITEEVRRHLFEPFFTTKTGRGTGLGLAVVHGIVTQTGGHIEIVSEPNAGATFHIYLPVTRDVDDQRAAPARGPTTPRRATILLAEDDAAVRRLLGRVLEGCGHTVVQASNGDEAMAIAFAERRRFDLLITDVVMPETGGRVLAERLRAADPDLKVLFMSGYTDDAIMRQGVLQEQVNFVHKPVSPAVLSERVAAILAS